MGYNGSLINETNWNEEERLSRVINVDAVGKERNRLRKEIVISIRAFMSETGPTETAKDAAAHIVLALRGIYDTVEQSVVAWEKRGYWVKADRFRLEWEWTLGVSNKLETALKQQEWAEISQLCIQIAQRFYNVTVSPNHRMGTPWVGSWKKLFSV